MRSRLRLNEWYLISTTGSLQLLRTFYAQGLVDNKTFLIWLVQTMANCNLAQAGFVAHLADEYLDGMLTSRPLAKPFVDACLAKLVEVGCKLTMIAESCSSRCLLDKRKLCGGIFTKP